MQNLYLNSPTAAQNMEDVIARYGVIRIGTAANDQPAFFGTNAALTFGYIGINFAAISQVRYFNSFGKVVAEDPRLALIHEINHLLLGDTDPLQDDALMNAGGFDFDGDVLRRQNIVATELGIPDHVQRSYLSGINPAVSIYNQLTLGRSYSNDAPIDIVRYGDVGTYLEYPLEDLLDMSNYGASRDLLFGFEGLDDLRGGGGDDHLYGGNGEDYLDGGDGDDRLFSNMDKPLHEAPLTREYSEMFGGAGRDSLYGSSGTDWLYGGEGNDLLIGGTGQDHLFGGDGDDILIPGRNATVRQSWSAEKIDGGEGNDIVWLDRDFGENEDHVFADSGDGDRLFWNGYQLTGGTFMIIEEEGNTHEVWLTGYVDAQGVVYRVQDGTLSIYLPLETSTPEIYPNPDIVLGWSNGKWGITLDLSKMNAPYETLTHSNIAFDGKFENFHELAGRAAALANPGPMARPDAPLPASQSGPGGDGAAMFLARADDLQFAPGPWMNVSAPDHLGSMHIV